MTLEELAYISQIVSVAAILVSLVAVYWQLRQTNMIARADLTHNTMMEAGQLHTSFYDTPEKADLMYRALRGIGELNGDEKLQLNAVFRTAIVTHQSAFLLRKSGLFEAGAYEEMETVTHQYMRSTFVRDWWRQNRNDKNAKFAAVVDKMIAEIEARKAEQETPERSEP